MSRLYKKLTFSLLAVSLNIASPLWAADNYEILDLGTLSGTKSEAFSINNLGDIVGNSSGADFSDHAFVYRNQQITDLGFLPVDVNSVSHSLAFAINDNGLAVGYSLESFVASDNSAFNVNIAVYYDTNSQTINRIPQFDLVTSHAARGVSINDNNLIVGHAKYDPPNDLDVNGDPATILYDRGFFYDIANDQLTVVNTLDESTIQNMVLRDVNNNGIAVGVSTEVIDVIGTTQVVTVDKTDPTLTTKLTIFGGYFQQPWSINDSNMIVGQARISIDRNSNDQAFLYDMQTAQVTGLGYLNSNFQFSAAYDINSSNQIVGISKYKNSPNIYHAFIYENGQMKDLDKLIGCDTGWILNEARSINDSGMIAGTGIFAGEKHGFMLTPTAGSAPICVDPSSSNGGGSIPVFLLAFFGYLLIRRDAKTITRL